MERVRFFSGLQLKIAITYIAFIAAILVLLNTYPLIVSQDLIFRSKQSSLQSQAAVMTKSLGVLGNLTADGVEQVMTLLDAGGLQRVLVTNETGLVIYDTQPSAASARYAPYDEVSRALSGMNVVRVRFLDGVFHSAAAAPILHRSQTVVGSIYLYERDSVQGALLRTVQNNLRTVSLVVCVFITGLSLLFSKALTRRISALLQAMRVVREGEYGHRTAIRGKDELAQLGTEFNRLTDRIQKTEDMRRRFVADASHELKTPLASIRLLADSILQSGDMDADTCRDFVSDIGREAKRLSHITEKLLALTRLDNAVDTERAGPLDVWDMAENVLHTLTPLARAEQVSLVFGARSPGCVAEITEDALHQIVFNLVENAVKYNQPGGLVEVALFRQDEWVVLRVSDTGLGIPEEELSRVFERFYRVDKARSRNAGGTGLGLSIAQEAARQFGGRITAEPRPGGGTCFTALLPHAPPAGE